MTYKGDTWNLVAFLVQQKKDPEKQHILSCFWSPELRGGARLLIPLTRTSQACGCSWGKRQRKWEEGSGEWGGHGEKLREGRKERSCSVDWDVWH